MNLSKLDIYGFKSFGSRSILEFSDNKKCSKITAIVGPNGSGKSNVADAVRWVLGEQSANNLRSKKGDDVIFCGSETKSRGSYAEATILLSAEEEREVEFNNKKHKFREIEVTRRLYRTGDSDYLINHKKVRLLDVQELLSSLGFGQSTYTVIGQGVVDRLLFFNAAERRVLFDEAAGIKQYKIKKEQATKKLIATDENIVRLNDILSQLGPRVADLARLVKRAEGRKNIETELAEIESHYYSSVQTELTAEIKGLEAKKNELAEQAKKLERKAKELKTSLAEGREVEKIAAEKDKIEGEIGELLLARDKLIREVAFLEGQISKTLSKYSAERENELAVEKQALIGKNTFLEKKIKENEAESLKVKSDKEEVESNLKSASLKLETLERKTEKNSSDSDKIKLGKLQEKIDILEKEKSSLSGKLYYLREEKRLSDLRLEQEAVRKKELENKIASVEEQRKTLIAKGNQLKLEITGAKEAEAKLVNEIGRIEKELFNRSATLSKEKIEDLTTAISLLEKEHKEIWQLIEKPQKTKPLPKVFKVFSDKLSAFFKQIGTVTLAAGLGGQEKLEKELRQLRFDLMGKQKELSVLEISFGKISAEIGLYNKELLQNKELLRSNELELEKEGRLEAENEDTEISEIKQKLEKVTTNLSETRATLKPLLESENEKANRYLLEKNEYQKTIAGLNSQLYSLEIDLTKKHNLIENQNRELGVTKNRLAEVEKKLAELTGTTKSPKEESSELESKKEALKKIEQNLIVKRSDLAKVTEQKRKHEELSHDTEVELNQLEKEIALLEQEMSQVDLDKTKEQVRYEDLKEEVKRSDVSLASNKSNKILNQSEKDLLRAKIENLKRKKEATFGIDPEMIAEYEELKTKSEEMKQQIDDLSLGKKNLEKIITELDTQIKNKFSSTFREIAAGFSHYFVTLFGGGKAELKLGEDEEGNLGVEISASPPGKRLQSLNVLSGGERTLTSLALLFAILSVNPSPFCVLDEVDAALDESNTLRFIEILKELAKKTQFVIISHNRETMNAADLLYGVTMNENHISKLISVKLEEAKGLVE